MNTHDIELPPLPVPRTKTDGGIELFAEYSVREYTRAAIEPYKQRISELEAQLEAVGAGGVSAGQRLMTREAVGLQAPSVALLLKIKTYTAACAERLGQPEIDRRWADICSAARDYAAEQVELDRQRRGEPVAWQPIETAPKDGTTILVWFKQHGAMTVCWGDRDYDHTSEYAIWLVDDHKHGPYPVRGYSRGDDTHWMPLPDAPQPVDPAKVPSDDERAAQGLPPYNPRHLTEEEWSRLAENGRRAWGKKPDEPEKEPPCDT